MKRAVVAVTISRSDSGSKLPDMPWHFFSGDNVAPDLPEIEYLSLRQSAQKNADALARYIAYLATKRNRAVEAAIEKYPETTDVMLCDSYYVHQTSALTRLISDYFELPLDSVILGGAVWGRIKPRTRVRDFIGRSKIEWYDKWSYPDLRFTPFGWNPEEDFVARFFRPPLRGLYRVSSIGGVSIWPRSVWEAGTRFGVFEDMHGCELNYFFEHASLPKYVDLNAVFRRDHSYTFAKAMRCALHPGRFVPKGRAQEAMRRLWDQIRSRQK